MRGRAREEVAREYRTNLSDEDRKELREDARSLRSIKGIGKAYEARLQAQRVRNTHDLLHCNIGELSSKTDISETLLSQWKEEAKVYHDGGTETSIPPSSAEWGSLADSGISPYYDSWRKKIGRREVWEIRRRYREAKEPYKDEVRGQTPSIEEKERGREEEDEQAIRPLLLVVGLVVGSILFLGWIFGGGATIEVKDETGNIDWVNFEVYDEEGYHLGTMERLEPGFFSDSKETVDCDGEQTLTVRIHLRYYQADGSPARASDSFQMQCGETVTATLVSTSPVRWSI